MFIEEKLENTDEKKKKMKSIFSSMAQGKQLSAFCVSFTNGCIHISVELDLVLLPGFYCLLNVL